jgi:hypothetical protein
MRRSSRRLPLAGLLVGLFAGVSCWVGSCAYAPELGNGTLQCGSNGKCPKGYACATDNTCWQDGAKATADGGSNPDTGTTPDPRLGNFLGTWLFSSGTLDATCTDGSAIHRALTTTDYIIMASASANAGLLLEYYCQKGWNLRLPAGSTTATAPVGQTCRELTTDSGVTTTYDWTAASLTFATGDGRTATAAGHLTGAFTATDGAAGTCQVMFNGPLAKS